MEQEITAVRVVHDITNRMVYNLYAEFFRFIGVFVGEHFLMDYTEEHYEEDVEYFDSFLCIADYPDKDSIPNATVAEKEAFIYIDANSYKEMTFVDAGSSDLKSLMESVLNQIHQREMNDLISIFIKNEVLRGACQLQYYRLKSSLHRDSEEIFKRAVKALLDLKEDSKCVRYARLYCQQKANLACNYQVDRPLAYDVQQLIDECVKLINDYPDFTNAQILLGMICEMYTDYYKFAIAAYKNAIEKIGKYCYASNVYYWIGYLYEKLSGYHEDAQLAYTKAYDLKKKYRNIYKVAMMKAEEEDFCGQQKYFIECLDYLERLQKYRMDPLEIEYYYKVGVLTCYNYVFHLKEYEKAIECGEKVLHFYNNVLNKENEENFVYFYGNSEHDYRDLSKNRISRNKVFECLAIAYRENGEKDKSEEFWRLSQGK